MRLPGIPDLCCSFCLLILLLNEVHTAVYEKTYVSFDRCLSDVLGGGAIR